MSDEPEDSLPPQAEPVPEATEAPNGKALECMLCPLYDAPGPVPGEGPSNAKLFILGEAPGKDEVLFRRPFIGGSGRVLNRMLEKTRIRRSLTYVTNVVKCRPTVTLHTGDVKDRPPTDEEITCCARFLLAELESVKPNLILGVGGTALYVLKDTNKIGQHRGTVFQTSFGKALCTYHPAGLMRQQKNFPLALRDLALAAKEAESPTFTRVEVSYNPDALARRDGAAMLDRARRSGLVVLDLETSGLGRWGNQILCIGAGTELHSAECYTWDSDTQALIRALWEDPGIEKANQNCEDFDWPVLEEHGMPETPKGKSFDTLLAFHLTNSDLKKDLGTLGTVYSDMEYWKHEGKKAFRGNDFRALKVYNCKDVDGTYRATVELREELKRMDLHDLYYTSVMPLQPVLRRMTKRGIRKNLDLAANWSVDFEFAADRMEQKLRDHLGQQDFSVNSPQQLRRLLYEPPPIGLGLPVQYRVDRDRGSVPTVNEEAIEALAILTDDPTFRQIYEIRSIRKWKSTYIEADTDADGFMHPHFGCAKAANGRLNSWEPNAQNWPPEMRELVIPDTEEHIFISADWSQIEWRISMILAADPVGLELLLSGKDNHAAIAAETLGVRYEDVTEDQRHASKFIVYGLTYGRQAASIAKQLGKPKDWVQAFIDRFFRRFGKYAITRTHWEDEVRRNNCLKNPFKRRRWWYTMQVTELYNFPPSSTAADMMYLVIPVIESQLPPGATLRLTVHDELVVCSPKDCVREAVSCLVQNMQRTWPNIVEASENPALVKKLYPNGWYCPSDFNLGRNWKECKPKSKEDKQTQRDLKKHYGFN